MNLTFQILQQSAVPELTEHNGPGNLGKTVLQVAQKQKGVFKLFCFLRIQKLEKMVPPLFLLLPAFLG